MYAYWNKKKKLEITSSIVPDNTTLFDLTTTSPVPTVQNLYAVTAAHRNRTRRWVYLIFSFFFTRHFWGFDLRSSRVRVSDNFQRHRKPNYCQTSLPPRHARRRTIRSVSDCPISIVEKTLVNLVRRIQNNKNKEKPKSVYDGYFVFRFDSRALADGPNQKSHFRFFFFFIRVRLGSRSARFQASHTNK